MRRRSGAVLVPVSQSSSDGPGPPPQAAPTTMAQITGAPRAPAGALTPRPRPFLPRGLVPLALRNPAYRRVWAGIAFLFMARWIEIASFSWLAVERTTDPLAIAMVGFTRIMPFF